MTSRRAETWKQIWQKMDIFGVWEWMDGSWLNRSYIYILLLILLILLLLLRLYKIQIVKLVWPPANDGTRKAP